MVDPPKLIGMNITMKRSPILLILLGLTFSLSEITFGADHRGFDKKKLTKVGNEVQRLIDEKFIAGAVTLVARDGEIAHQNEPLVPYTSLFVSSPVFFAPSCFFVDVQCQTVWNSGSNT